MSSAAMISRMTGLGVLALAIVTSGCLESPELVELSLPKEVQTGEAFGVRWAIANRDQSEAEHSEIHWSLDNASFDKKVVANLMGDGRYSEPSCGPNVFCAPGSYFVALITAPEGANTLYYQIHTKGNWWEVESKIVEARIVE